MEGREDKVELVCEQIEKGLELVGSTAIEDKLQDGVGETVRYMRDAGIKVWVLTGDKVETAINIGYSSGLLDNTMRKFEISDPNRSVLSQLTDAYAELHKNPFMKSALIINGDALHKVLTEDKLREEFLNVSTEVSAVLACRVSPKQKADVVSTVRKKYPNKTTLSIGDGANDVNMITTAHVGIGISGLEG